MFGKRINLFNILGFKVWIDLSWIIIAVLVTWTLAAGIFPFYYRNLTSQTYWVMGLIGALGLFSSIIIHELCHSLVSRRFGLPIRGITLFVFGGVSEMSDEPPSAKAEFMMAIAGPASSIILGLGLYGIFTIGRVNNWPEPVIGVTNYLAMINGLLAAFNLVPAYPLDGGRVLRSALWKWKDNIQWATRVASQIGSGFAILMMVLGIFNIVTGNFVGGMWWFLIGLFLKNASQSSYQQILIRNALEGEPVSHLMKTDPVSIPPSITIEELVENYIYRYHYKMFPVVEDSNSLVGCITTKQVQDIPRELWRQKTVGESLRQCSDENTIEPQADALKALQIMNKTGASRLLVTEGKHLVGIIALKDMLRYFSFKMELERQ